MGKLKIFNSELYVKHHVMFLLIYACCELLILFSQLNEIKYFIYLYSCAIIFLSAAILYDGWNFSTLKASNVFLKIMDSVPYFSLIFLVLSRLITNFTGVVSVPASINEEHMLWGYIVLLGIININLCSTIIQYQYKTILEKSRLDGLTNIYLRNTIVEKIKYEYLRALRYKETFSLVFLDIDHFKKINDTYGHNVGDSVLKHVAHLLKTNFRSSDIVGRWGGEEFVVVLPKTGIDQASISAEKIRKILVESPLLENGLVVNLSASFGVTESSRDDVTDEITVNGIVNRADSAMYESKKTGRNRVTKR